MKIERKREKFELDFKRVYLPFVISGECPACNAPVSRDFTQFGLSYPTANESFKDWVGCLECDHEIEIRLKLTVDLTLEAPHE